MRLLHTSDWHIGRTFHGHSTDEHLAQVLAAITVAVAEHGVDAVIVAGDVFDTSTPKADAFTMLGDAVRAIREAGATVILTSGNHDGPQRLGHMAEFASFGGVHVRTEVSRLAEPVTLSDEHGVPDPDKPEKTRGGEEPQPEGLTPKAGYSSIDPRSKD